MVAKKLIKYMAADPEPTPGRFERFLDGLLLTFMLVSLLLIRQVMTHEDESTQDFFERTMQSNNHITDLL